MSFEGLVYVFACQMLYAVFQLIYEFHDDFAPVVNRIINAEQAHNAEDLMGWTIEENAVPFIHERLQADQAVAIGNFAETSATSISKYVYGEILVLARNLYQADASIEEFRYAYNLYCRFLVLVLQEFDELMRSGEMRSTLYSQHYQQDKAMFEEIGRQLETLLTENTIDSLVESALKQLATEWKQAIYSAANDFTN